MAKDNSELIDVNSDVKDRVMEVSHIQSLIYVIRGKQVMLDSDLAILYQVETKTFNQAVKRNIERFPENFRFQLKKEEYDSLRSQFVTSKEGRGGRRYLPYVFTEQGIAMLSAVLRSDIAIQVSIRIMETFVEMRKYMANTSLLYDRMNAIEERQITYQNETNEKFDKVFAYISDHEESQQKIFFDGQIYDAFSLLIDLVASATKSLVLVDNYVDVGTLNILSKKKENVSVTIYTVRKTRLSEKDIETFNQQYPKEWQGLDAGAGSVSTEFGTTNNSTDAEPYNEDELDELLDNNSSTVPVQNKPFPSPAEYRKLSLEKRAKLLPPPSDDRIEELKKYQDRMGYTEESMRSMRYKMSVYDDFTEEYDYRVKYNRNHSSEEQLKAQAEQQIITPVRRRGRGR